LADNDEEQDWISTRVEAAAESVEEVVPAETCTMLEEAMRSTLGDRLLRPAELVELANNLIESTEPTETNGEETACD